MKKIPPPRVLHALRPPNPGFRYFENWQTTPFKPDALGFEMVNAWWLAEAALLAYGDEAFVLETFETSGLKAAGFIVQWFENRGTQCFVAHNDSFIVVSFRGTDFFEFQQALIDVATDARWAPVPDGAGSLVHQGFKEAISDVWEPLKEYLNRIQSEVPARTLWVTGHSLGGALATLAADRFIREEGWDVKGLYTFGSPRAGDSSFKNRLTEMGLAQRTFRFVNNNDVVARVPPRLVYAHVGSLKYLDDAGQLTSMDDDSLIARDAGVSHLSESLLEGIHAVTHLGNITNDVPDSLADHAPIYYAVHIWNNYDAA